MAINTLIEQPITLTEATTLVPRRRQGRKAAVGTLYRWSTVGCRRVVLETIQVGACRCTSREALQRFFERLTAQATGQPIEAQPSKQREREIREAEHALDEAGIS